MTASGYRFACAVKRIMIKIKTHKPSHRARRLDIHDATAAASDDEAAPAGRPAAADEDAAPAAPEEPSLCSPPLPRNSS